MGIQAIQCGTMEYLRAEGICVPHCFTTRRGGVSTGALESLNLGASRGDSMENVTENFRIVCRTLGFDEQCLVLTHQVHSDIVRMVSAADHISFHHHDYPPCDALITNTPGTALAAFTADCTPILLWDPVSGAIGAVHAGWRGTAADIAGKTVAAMTAAFGCDPGHIHAAIGPNLGGCCFETDADVPDALAAAFGDGVSQWIRRRENKFYPDLKQINAMALRRAGVTAIEISTDCTMCQSQRFWSHRVHGASRGALGAIIFCKEAHG